MTTAVLKTTTKKKTSRFRLVPAHRAGRPVEHARDFISERNSRDVFETQEKPAKARRILLGNNIAD